MDLSHQGLVSLVYSLYLINFTIQSPVYPHPAYTMQVTGHTPSLEYCTGHHSMVNKQH